jgi:Trypsin-like peptidase domain
MEEPGALRPTELRDLDNVPPERPVDEELIQAIRSEYVEALASRDGPQPVEDARVLELVEGDADELEDDLLASHRPDWLGIGFQPQFAPEPTRRYGRRANGTRVEFDEIWGSTIFGRDDRIDVYPSLWPQSCVCMLQVEVLNLASGQWAGVKTGTGFMVGSRIVATAAHMLPLEAIWDPAKPPWRITVTPAYYDGASVFGHGIATTVSNVVWYQRAPGPNVPIRISLDMALMRTRADIGSLVGFLGSWPVVPSQGGAWWTIGYGYDRSPWRPKIQTNVALLSLDDRTTARAPSGRIAESMEIETDADGANGNSGGPLFEWFRTPSSSAVISSRPYVFGVWSSHEIECKTSVDQFNVFAGGPLLNETIRWARANWP